MRTRYVIDRTSADGENRKRVEHDQYNKALIENDFIELCNAALPGDVIEYWKQDDKYFYNPLLTVEHRNGKLVRWVQKGSRTFYAQFNFFGKAEPVI